MPLPPPQLRAIYRSLSLSLSSLSSLLSQVLGIKWAHADRWKCGGGVWVADTPMNTSASFFALPFFLT